MATRYQRGNQNMYIKEEQTTQWPQDIKGVIRILWYLVAIVLSVLLRYTDSDYPFDILWPLCCLFFFDIQILITPLISCGHWVGQKCVLHGSERIFCPLQSAPLFCGAGFVHDLYRSREPPAHVAEWTKI
jgi:hypothetical protein